jgi:hypothetical protein
MSQCPSCGGDCGYTKKGGCLEMPTSYAISQAANLLNKKVIEMVGAIMSKHTQGVLAACAEDRLYTDHLLGIIKSYGIPVSHESGGRTWYSRKEKNT